MPDVGCALVNVMRTASAICRGWVLWKMLLTHVNAACTLADNVVCKVQSVALNKLLTTSDGTGRAATTSSKSSQS